MAGLTKRVSYTGKGTQPEFPPLKGDFSPWTGGFPPNPVKIVSLIGTATKQSPSKSIFSGLNPGNHLGIFKHRQSSLPPISIQGGGPWPINIPNRFRITPPPVSFGARPLKLGNFHVPADLHASVLPSNPMVFRTVETAKEQVNSTLNNNATLRGFVKRMFG